MKKLALILLMALGVLSASASHLMGGQITARQLSGLTYEVTLTLYRDVNGIPLGSTSNLDYVNSVTNSTVNRIVNRASFSNLYTVVEEHIYIDTIVFQNTGHFQIIYKACCRNAAICNLNLSTGSGFYIQNILLVDTIAGNSSPLLLNPPIPVAQKNAPFIYNPLPYDADGDSLAWRIDTPYTSILLPPYGVPISYHIAWVPWMQQILINANNGELTWTPPVKCNVVVSILITEFRNGNMIGEIRRDMQIIVVDDTTNWQRASYSSNNWPTNTQGDYHFVIPSKTNLSFNINASDAGGDSLVITANSELLNRTINPAVFASSSSSGAAAGVFNWKPGILDLRPHPYIVVFRLLEFHNNYMFMQDRSVLITVSNSTSVTELPSPYSIGSLYPNPVKGEFYLPTMVKSATALSLIFTNALGQQIKIENRGKLVAGQNIIYVSDLNLSKGLYFVNVLLDGKNAKSLKLVVE